MQLIQTLRLINPIVPDGLIDFPNPTEKCSPQWIEVLMQIVGWKLCLHTWVGTEKPITMTADHKATAVQQKEHDLFCSMCNIHLKKNIWQ